jgi:putative transposase
VTKYRRKVLLPNILARIKELFDEIAKEIGCEILAFEGGEDHIHLFISTSPQKYLPNLVKQFKGVSARKVFEEFPEIKEKLWGGHLWSPSYFARTAGDVSSKTIKRYIENSQTRDGRKRDC